MAINDHSLVKPSLDRDSNGEDIENNSDSDEDIYNRCNDSKTMMHHIKDYHSDTSYKLYFIEVGGTEEINLLRFFGMEYLFEVICFYWMSIKWS